MINLRESIGRAKIAWRRHRLSAAQRKATARQPLSLEPLEDRRMLALDVPLLSSLPGAPVTIHLDFDGTPAFVFEDDPRVWASGPMPGDSDPIPAFSIDGDFNNYSDAEISGISQIWQHVSEKFSPFKINVTTIAPADYPDGVAVHAIIGGSKNDWYNKNVSGVAWFNAFTNARPNSAFTFSGDLIAAGSTTLSDGDRYKVAETVAHEVSHTFGLQHQSVVDGFNNVIVEYSTGTSNAAPVMGNSADTSKRGVWWWGPSSRRNAEDNLEYAGIQDDLATMTRPGNFINYRTDDFGDFGGAGTLFVDPATGSATGGGILETNGDRDALIFTAIGPIVQFTVTNARYGGMLLPDLELIPLSGSAGGNVTVTRSNFDAKLSATNLTPGGGYLLRVKPQFASGGGQYDSLGQYNITGTTGAFASLANGVITVNGYDTGNDLAISYISSTDMIVLQDDVFGGSAVQQFPRAQVTAIEVKFGTGFNTDTVDVLGQYTALNIPIYINGAGDQIEVEGTTGNDFFAIDKYSIIANNTAIWLVAGSYFSEIRISGFDGADVFEVTSSLTSLRLLGNADDDTFTVGTAFSTINDIVYPVFAFGDLGSDTLNMGYGNADAIAADVTFDGGTGGGSFIDTIDYNDGAKTSTVEYTVDYDIFNVNPSTVVRHGSVGPRTLIYRNVYGINFYAGSGNDYFTVGSNVAEVVGCFGNSGNDSITFGDGLLGPLSGHVFNGGMGTDTLTFDDHNNPSSIIWDVLTDRVIYAGAIIFLTAGFEGVDILSGNGDDVLQMGAATYAQAITLDGGGGVDWMRINGARTTSLTVRGGNDSAVDLLDIDDRNFPGNVNGGDVYADRISRDMFPSQSSDVFYSGFSNVNWYQQATQNAIRVFGMSSDIGSNYQFSIIGNSLNDYVEVYARDVMGNQTINGNLNFIGGGDFDQLSLVSGNLPANYRFYKQFSAGDAYIGGAGNGWISAATTVENITTLGSPGSDTFAVEHFNSGAALAIYGGAGDDSCTIGNGDMSANLTNAAAFTFDGQGDSDRFTIANYLTTTRWDYYTGDGFVRAARPATGYLWHSVTTNIESQYFLAGSEGDAFYLDVVSPGVYTECNGFGGIDGLGLGFATNNLETIQGPIVYDAGFDGGNIAAYDLADTTGDVVHLDAISMGAYAGDTLFGAGGSLTFSNLVNFGVYPGITLSLGSGADTVFAQPLATARVDIHGNDPTSAPGDGLNLALGAAQNYVIAAGSSGNVISSNLQTLSWTGIEGPFGVDNVAPQVVDAVYENLPTPTVRYRFSENVSLSLNLGHLLLVNTTTGAQISSAVMSLSYDQGTNTARFTFPGLPNGVLPSGHYSATIASSVADAAGNQIGATSPLLFSNIPNAAPVANPDSFTVAEDNSLSGNVLGNDTDDSILPLVASIVLMPSHGTLTLSNNGTFQYTPALNFNGTDSFSYIATDALGASSLAATVTIEVTPVNDAPIANSDSFTVSGVGVLTGNVLANDTDDTLPLSAAVVTMPQHGALILSQNGSFQYTPTLGFSGTDSFTYIATDALGLSSLATTVTISVAPVTKATLVPDTCNPGKLALYVPGTAAADEIRIRPKGGSQFLEVLVNGISQGTFSPTGRIIVRAGAGNDTVHIVDEVSKSAWLYGEAGKDNLKGGAGPDVILGGSGDDTINGGNGRDLLIGGIGADRIVGGGADDLLIAGRTTFDNNDLALNGILAEWNSSRSYALRVANLRGTGTGTNFANRLNGNFFLQTEGPSATVLDDGAVDVVSGSGGFDWYLVNLDGTNVDKITDLTATERVDDLD